MEHQTIWVGISVFLLLEALALTALLAPVTVRLAYRWGFLAYPGERHLHKHATPTLGGLAIVAGFILVIAGNLIAARLGRHYLDGPRWADVVGYLHNIPSRLGELGAILAGALLMMGLGMVDDRRPLGPRLKLAIMVLATVPLLLAGVRVHGFLPYPWLGALVTVGWVVFITNSFNLMDNMDGLCAGVGAIVALAFGIYSFFAAEWFMMAIYAVLAGSLLGFLFHNFHPARMFMGDNGALFTGYLIGALSVVSTYYGHGEPTAWPVLTPLIVLGVPIFDTLSVIWIRWRSGLPITRGDKNHFSHRLLVLGMTTRGASTFIYIVTAVVALGALPLRQVGRSGAIAIVVQTALVFWIIYRIERTARRRHEGHGHETRPRERVSK